MAALVVFMQAVIVLQPILGIIFEQLQGSIVNYLNNSLKEDHGRPHLHLGDDQDLPLNSQHRQVVQWSTIVIDQPLESTASVSESITNRTPGLLALRMIPSVEPLAAQPIVSPPDLTDPPILMSSYPLLNLGAQDFSRNSAPSSTAQSHSHAAHFNQPSSPTMYPRADAGSSFFSNLAFYSPTYPAQDLEMPRY